MIATPPQFLSAVALVESAAASGPDTGARTSAEARPGVPGVAGLLARRLAADPARPLLTFYDDATGERVEFSATTLDNWVAKTANMLVDTVGLEPGERVGVDLPTHWLAVVVALASWSAGLDLVLADSDSDSDSGDSAGLGADGGRSAAAPPPVSRLGALFVAEDRLEATADLPADETVALSLRPLGGRLTRQVPGVLDYAAEVPPHGDRFAAPPAPPEQAGLVRAAERTAAVWGLGPDDRILVTAAMSTATGLLGGLLAPLAAGASIVLCRRLDPAVLARRLESERVSAVLSDADTLVPTPSALPERVRALSLTS
ncbi:conserved hypothetical protein [Frankia canadensis]|uniref:TIGR03089 family protein n=1 Tax=Frankia canadensis TaxID=1836972 RepID=A0A2I2KNT0_9ACTN|nr:TIGR03089 family protein [Frankia canadensis]SNQ47324.1 conserved hypothetical protein [Frankia canadensis]SOU54614.1 conserved hypothetical protein [Frankia canadensis]